jgi:hypothetical protein
MHTTMKQLEAKSPPNPFQCKNPKGKPGAEALKQEQEERREQAATGLADRA